MPTHWRRETFLKSIPCIFPAFEIMSEQPRYECKFLLCHSAVLHNSTTKHFTCFFTVAFQIECNPALSRTGITQCSTSPKQLIARAVATIPRHFLNVSQHCNSYSMAISSRQVPGTRRVQVFACIIPFIVAVPGKAQVMMRAEPHKAQAASRSCPSWTWRADGQDPLPSHGCFQMAQEQPRDVSCSESSSCGDGCTRRKALAWQHCTWTCGSRVCLNGGRITFPLLILLNNAIIITLHLKTQWERAQKINHCLKYRS